MLNSGIPSRGSDEVESRGYTPRPVIFLPPASDSLREGPNEISNSTTFLSSEERRFGNAS